MNRIRAFSWLCLAFVFFSGVGLAATERWGIAELAFDGPSSGNPFVDVELSAKFTLGDRSVDAAGFYDGAGRYKIRFMPDRVGEWTYVTKSNRPELDGKKGKIEVAAAAPGNHGPVRVRETFHFAYEDGTPYYPVGTTCYAWTHQGDALEERTLATLKAAPFNKMRMCVFPKDYAFNKNEPPLYPFAGKPSTKWDFTRFNPEFFRHLEKRVAELGSLGIEADLILLHPYDKGRWGFDRMSAEADDRYLRYVVARLSAFRNVWWSLANEWDFMKEKTEADWDRMLQVVQKADPYGHLRSIHNGTLIYNHNQPWITHASIQNGSAVEDFGRAVLYRDVYRKPIVYDEVKYEGNIPQRWGRISAEEMVHRFWQGTIAGTYVGHGETYLSPDQILWWSKGGVLHGQSPARIKFLRDVIESGPREGIEPIDKWQNAPVGGKRGEYYLVYLGKNAPREWSVELPRTKLTEPLKLQAEVLDTWNMTIRRVEGTFVLKQKDADAYACPDRPTIPLPGRPYMAIRLRKVTD